MISVESNEPGVWRVPPPGPVSRFFTTASGLRLHYLEWRATRPARDAPRATIVMIHGRRAHCRWFDPVASLLSSDYRCLSLDLRSHGESDRGPGPALFTDYGADIAEFLRAVPAEPVVVMPHSMAGRATVSALAGAADRPAFRPAALVLADTPMIRRPHHMFPEPNMKRRLSPDFHTAIRRFRLLPPGTSASRDVLAYIAAHSVREAPEGGWEWKYDEATTVRPVGAQLPDLEESGIGSITAPTLVIYGEHSSLVDEEHASRIAALMPDARVRRLAEAHHHLILDRPEEFVADVRGFLSDCGL